MMAVVGWLVLGALSFVAGLAALAVAVRSEPSGRAELGMVAFAVLCALLSAPVLLLGYADLLTPLRLALLSCLSSVLVLALAVRGWRMDDARRACREAAASLVRVPVDAIREAARARSAVTVALTYCVVVLAAAAVLTIFVPNATWDGFLYHEPIVGFAIQNHGFSMVDVPMNQANQAANGYPRLCESLSLWLVIFTDKTLIELPNLAAAPAMMLATFALARRFADRLTAMGWACVLLLMPQVWAQLCQTYIDLLVAFFALVAIYFATRPQLRVRDAWLAVLGAVLMLGSKSSALTTVPPLAVITFVRLIARHGRARKAATLLTIAVGSVLLVGVGAITPLRNWRAFHDPFWPVSYENAVLGIHWKGLITLEQLTSSTSFWSAMQTAYGAPIGGLDDAKERGYGYAIAWVLGPLAVLGILLAAVDAIAALTRKRARTTPAGLGLLLLVFGACVLTAPSLSGHGARYNLHIIACVMALSTWLLARPGWERVRSQSMAAAVVLAILPLHWMRGVGWYWVSTFHLEDVLRHPFRSRVALDRPSFDASGGAREELQPGDCVVFDENVGFVGALWNFHYSNRVRYVPYASNRAFFDEVARCDAKWVVVGESDDARKALQATGVWQYVGPLTQDTSAIYRRKPPS